MVDGKNDFYFWEDSQEQLCIILIEKREVNFVGSKIWWNNDDFKEFSPS